MEQELCTGNGAGEELARAALPLFGPAGIREPQNPLPYTDRGVGTQRGDH